MAEQSGPAASALHTVRSALATRQAAVADADRQLAEVLAAAHTAAVADISRLAAIAAEIDEAAADPAGFATDTSLGAREFQKFLIAKQRDVLAVVSAARALAEASSTQLGLLRSAYSPAVQG